MRQYLIGEIIKGKIDPEIQKGPGYVLDRRSIKTIVEYLKLRGLWTYDFIYETNAILPDEAIFTDLKILDPTVFEPGHQYSLDIGDALNYFTEGLPGKTPASKYLSIVAKPPDSQNVMFRHFLSKDFQDHFSKEYFPLSGKDTPIQIFPADVEIILNDQHYFFMYGFNFDTYRYFLEYTDPWDFIFESDVEWFKLLPSN